MTFFVSEENGHLPILLASTLNENIGVNHTNLPILDHSCPTKSQLHMIQLKTFLNPETLLLQ